MTTRATTSTQGLRRHPPGDAYNRSERAPCETTAQQRTPTSAVGVRSTTAALRSVDLRLRRRFFAVKLHSHREPLSGRKGSHPARRSLAKENRRWCNPPAQPPRSTQHSWRCATWTCGRTSTKAEPSASTRCLGRRRRRCPCAPRSARKR